MNAGETDSAGIPSEEIQAQESGSSGEASMKAAELSAGSDGSGKAAENHPANEKFLRLESMVGDLSSMISQIAMAVENFSTGHSRILEEISELRRQMMPRTETRVVEAEEMRTGSVFKGPGFSEKDVAIDKIFYSGRK